MLKWYRQSMIQKTPNLIPDLLARCVFEMDLLNICYFKVQYFIMNINVSSGMSMHWESPGFLSASCKCEEENHSFGETPKPVPGNEIIHNFTMFLF